LAPRRAGLRDLRGGKATAQKRELHECRQSRHDELLAHPRTRLVAMRRTTDPLDPRETPALQRRLSCALIRGGIGLGPSNGNVCWTYTPP
jgi:hypothetical protein